MAKDLCSGTRRWLGLPPSRGMGSLTHRASPHPNPFPHEGEGLCPLRSITGAINRRHSPSPAAAAGYRRSGSRVGG
jgi:hypothetical protein